LGRVRPYVLPALLLDRERSRPAGSNGRARAGASYRGPGGSRRTTCRAARLARTGRPWQHGDPTGGLIPDRLARSVVVTSSEPVRHTARIVETVTQVTTRHHGDHRSRRNNAEAQAP